jgi:hypothetical protein
MTNQAVGIQNAGMRRRFASSPAIALALLSLSILARAQTSSATWLGVVRDPSDALVADASVTIVNKETGAARKTSSDSKGEYTATNLAPGHYEVTVSKDGFSSVSEPDLLLQMDHVGRFDVRMNLSSTMQSVAVVAFTFGYAGRKILDGPGNISINTTLSRNFTILEHTRLQVRWEAFNVLNRANFQLPQNAVNAPNASTITAASPSRQMQFGLRYSF